MTFDDWRKEADFFTGKLSDITRYLAFSGIAVVWIFRSQDLNNLIPEDLEPVLFWLVLALIFDIVQYLYGSLVWSIYIRKHEYLKTKNDKQIEPHIMWKLITFIPFLAKVYALIHGYLILLCFLYNRL